ncbi:MAG TPA: ATP-binding cassette domain-containing protein [Solirubrobacteraceae bacterium]|nr:ATP-binding cassette domain-containing protein [Solirubrobacteraceae bacterium]
MELALLSLSGVCKSYWRGAREIAVLDDVSLELSAGEVLAVWGQRGAGKSTLAMIAAGLETADRGAVCFEGQGLVASRGAGAPRLREGIGWVHRMGPRSADFRMIVDYVALPLLGAYSPRAARRRASSMLGRLGVADCAEACWESLTDGERTLVALAHALVREPRLLVADGPTANLNVLQREEVTALLRRAADEEGLGILITVPDMPEMVYADQIGSLSDGRLVIARLPPAAEGIVVDFPGRQQSA